MCISESATDDGVNDFQNDEFLLSDQDIVTCFDGNENYVNENDNYAEDGENDDYNTGYEGEEDDEMDAEDKPGIPLLYFLFYQLFTLCRCRSSCQNI